jgi:hypothetical protein
MIMCALGFTLEVNAQGQSSDIKDLEEALVVMLIQFVLDKMLNEQLILRMKESS